MNPIILSPAMELLSLGAATSLGEKNNNSEFKPVKLHLKVDLVSYPARVEGFGKYKYGDM